MREAYETLEVAPPRFRVVQEKLIVDPERYEDDETEMRPQSVVVADAFETLTLIAPKFRQEDKMVVATPAHRDFQLGASGRYEEVLIPADERPIQTEILVAPAKVDRQAVPAKVQTTTIKVVTRRVGTGRLLPARIVTVTRRALVQPALARRVRISALTQRITRHVLGRPANLRRIPCD